MFKDITTLLQDSSAFNETIDVFYNALKDKKLDAVVGIESRGFIFAAPLALKLGCRFVLARKPGKLPRKTLRQNYDLEYGTDGIEIHSDSIKTNDRVVIIDDLLATGGTAQATGKIVNKLNGIIVYYAFLISLKDLDGCKKLGEEKIFSILDL